MARTVELVHDYDVPPRRLWELVTDYDALAEVMRGVASFRGLPDGRVREGQDFAVDVSLFGVLPWQSYRMEVVECDDENMRLSSSERGAGVRSWRHRLTVEPHGAGARLTDRIEIDAGALTPLFARWARHVYSARHKPRLRLLAEGADERPADIAT